MRTALVMAVALTLVGCQTFGARESDDLDAIAEAGAVQLRRADVDGIRQVGYEEDQLAETVAEEPSFWEQWSPAALYKGVEKWAEKPVRPEAAKDAFLKAEAKFKEGHPETNRPAFLEAAKLYAAAANNWPDSAMEQDSLYMVAECLYFAQHFVDADDAYGKLIKTYPNTRHMDAVAARRFKIAQYWIELERGNPNSAYRINLFDERYPWRDNIGSAVRTFDQIRIDDITGRLADDATMAAGNAHFQNGDYYSAADSYMELVDQFPGSPHVFDAMFLCVKCRLVSYRGPAYNATGLDDAEKLIKEMRRRFPKEAEEKRDYLTRAAAEVHYRKAELEYTMARYYERRAGYGGARYYYRRLAEKYGDTPFAEEAETRMAAIADQPDKPVKTLAWLEDYMPKNDPFKGVQPLDGSADATKPVLR